MRLRREVIHLIGPDIRDQRVEVAAVREIAVVQEKPILEALVVVKMIDALRADRTMPPDDPVHLVPFLDEEIRQIGPVLPGDACDECFFQ